jgi:hypothetical protein
MLAAPWSPAPAPPTAAGVATLWNDAHRDAVDGRRKAEARVTAMDEYVRALQEGGRAQTERLRVMEAERARERAALAEECEKRLRGMEAERAALAEECAARVEEARAAGALAETTSLAHDALALHGATLVAAAEAASALVTTATVAAGRGAADDLAVAAATAAAADAEAGLAQAAGELAVAAVRDAVPAAVDVVLAELAELERLGAMPSGDDGGAAGGSCGQQAGRHGYGGGC